MFPILNASGGNTRESQEYLPVNAIELRPINTIKRHKKIISDTISEQYELDTNKHQTPSRQKAVI